MDNMSFLGDSTALNAPSIEVWRPTPSSSMLSPLVFSKNNQQLAPVFTQTSIPIATQAAGQLSTFILTSILPTIQDVGGSNAFAQTFMPLVNQPVDGPDAFVQTSLSRMIQDTTEASVFAQTPLITHTTIGANSASHTSAYLTMVTTNTLSPLL